MLGGVLSALDWVGRFSDPLAWLVLAAFLSAAVLDWRDYREVARRVAVAGWALFGVFWFTLIYHFAFVQKSIIEGLGSLVAVPAALYVGYLLWQGRDSLFVLTRAVAIMGIVFFPFETITVLQGWLIETVTRQTEFLLSLLGFEPTVLDPSSSLDDSPYRNTFFFEAPAEDRQPITYSIIIACTGIGSMAIFAGLVLAVEGPPRRKLRALAASLPVIYVLNLFRNVFIAIGFGEQYAEVFPDLVTSLFSLDDPNMVAYIVADRIVAQGLSVVALVGITYLVVRELPEVLSVIEDLLYVVTGSEYDLAASLDVAPVRADGGE